MLSAPQSLCLLSSTLSLSPFLFLFLSLSFISALSHHVLAASSSVHHTSTRGHLRFRHLFFFFFFSFLFFSISVIFLSVSSSLSLCHSFSDYSPPIICRVYFCKSSRAPTALLSHFYAHPKLSININWSFKLITRRSKGKFGTKAMKVTQEDRRWSCSLACQSQSTYVLIGGTRSMRSKKRN